VLNDSTLLRILETVRRLCGEPSDRFERLALVQERLFDETLQIHLVVRQCIWLASSVRGDAVIEIEPVHIGDDAGHVALHKDKGPVDVTGAFDAGTAADGGNESILLVQ